MAGGIYHKSDSKKKSVFTGFTNEVIKDSGSDYQPSKPKAKIISGLSGILGLGQTVELTPKESKTVLFTNYLEKESKVLLDNHQHELQKQISQLQSEIQKLIAVTDDLNQEIKIAALQPIVEISQSQLSFLERIRLFISDFRKNISLASAWLESLGQRKRKRNHYWSTFKNKKGGGEQYLFSGEHSAARSAT